MVTTPSDATPLESALTALRAGQLVGMPTETVYGLAADATLDLAVARVYAAKGRPELNPLIAHVHSVDAARPLVEWTPTAERLASAFWPGPLTLVLQRSATCPVSRLASAGLDSLALRVPSHPLALRLLAAFGAPLVAPSANRSGRISPTEARHVHEELGRSVEVVLDGGPCEVGLESTVIDLSGSTPTLLRPGGLPRAAIEALVGPLASAGAADRARPHAPGLAESHYAPGLPVRLNATHPQGREALLAFGDVDVTGFAHVSWLARPDEPEPLLRAAARLFGALRACDDPRFDRIAVSPLPEDGLGEALNDRLRRAAAERPEKRP